MKVFTFLISFCFCSGLFGQSKLQLFRIMAGNDFIGHQPENIHWSDNSKEIYFQWNPDNNLTSSYYTFNIKEQKIRNLSVAEIRQKAVDGFIPFKEYKGGLLKKSGRLYLLSDGKSEILINRFSRYTVVLAIDPDKIVIQENNDLFLLQRSPFLLRQLTNFKSGTEAVEQDEEIFLTRQQKELFEIVRLNNKRDSARKAWRDSISYDEPQAVYLDKKNLARIDIDPNLKYCVFRLDQNPDNTPTHIESYVTEDGYSRSVNARAKVGAQNPSHQLFVTNFSGDSTIEINFSSLSGIKKRPAFLKEYEEDFKTESDKPKNIIHHIHGFNADGNKLLVEIKSYDNKDRWIAIVNLPSGKITEIDHQHDEAWIGGPGITGWNMVAGNVGWIDNDQLYFQSEESGYSHLYIHSVSGSKTEALTGGNWEVHKAELSKDKKHFYITANKKHPGNREFYLLDIASKKLDPVFDSDGNHEVYISPDEKWATVRYSYKNKPWELYFAQLKPGTELKKITKSTSKEFDAYSWREPEVITFKARDDKAVYARIYRPEESKKNGAGVIFVHGAGYLQNAHNWWSGYYREYMFNNLLCDLGYTVLDIDYRASKGYGRDWRTAIYRHMGGWDLNDNLDGRKYLVEEEGVDPERVGIYGGSYGGFITLMGLLTSPGDFKCGAALRSVTDWAHYNHPYTSNILNTPEEDPKAFEKSSPIYFAENLEDRLVMLHGVEDDNVQYQDVIRLSQRFIESGKKDWNLVSFPIEPHGFKETPSWIEEYRRILKLFEMELN